MKKIKLKEIGFFK